MNTEIFEILPALTIEGLWIGIAVFCTVQAFKYARLFAWAWLDPARLSLISGFFWGLFWVAIQIEAAAGVWSVAAVAGMIFRWFIGSISASLFYAIALKPLLKKLGVDEKYYAWQKEKEDTIGPAEVAAG